jgi:hypothetical protein
MSSPLATYGNIPEILQIEQEILKMPQVDLPLMHYLIPGVYVRRMSIPAGTILTGKIHNFESIAILAEGTLRIADNEHAHRISAPHVLVDKPGIKRLGFAETDVTFLTVHSIKNQSIADIENELVSNSFEEFETQLQLLGELQ